MTVQVYNGRKLQAQAQAQAPKNPADSDLEESKLNRSEPPSELNEAFFAPQEIHQSARQQKDLPQPLTVVEQLKVQLQVRKTEPIPATVRLSPR
jgi:hypothetical protein